MGEHWYLLIGVGMWTGMAVMLWRGRHQPHPTGCPTCGHDSGQTGNHCSEIDDTGGWTSDPCKFTNDYHRTYAAHGVP